MAQNPYKNQPAPGGYNVGFRQGQGPVPTQGNVPINPVRGSMGGGRQQNINQTVNTAPQQQQPNTGGYEAMVQALAAQQAQQQANQQNRMGRGMMYAPGNNPRNIAAGALQSWMGDRSQKRSTKAGNEALRLKSVDEQEQLEKKARAIAGAVKANGGTQDQQDAAYEMALSGQSFDMPDGPEAAKMADYTALQNQVEKVVGADFNERTEAIRDIATYAKHGTGFSDHALIFRYMKFLDPGSTVREGEFATVEDTAGVPDRLRVAFNKTRGGEKLSDSQRQEIVGAVTAAYPAYVEKWEERMIPFKERADHFVMDWDLVSVPSPYVMDDVEVAQTDTEDYDGEPPPDGRHMEYKNGQWVAVKDNE